MRPAPGNELHIVELLNIYGKDTLKNKILRKIIEADAAEQSEIFDGKVAETHLSVLPSFIEMDTGAIGITHEEAFGTFFDVPRVEEKNNDILN
jgi:hypothetical protein